MTVSARSGLCAVAALVIDGQRRLQRVGEVAGVAPRLFGLHLVMLDQRVQFLGQRLDLARQPFLDPRFLARADRRDGAADPAQRPKPVNRLQSGEDDQAEAEDTERTQQGAAEDADLFVDHVAALRDLEAPAHRRAGQADVALDHPELLLGEFVAVVIMGIVVAVARPTSSRRSQSEREGRARRPAPLIW